jgi:hypothetical protein
MLIKLWQKYIEWENEGIHTSDWYDINGVKLMAACLVLLIARYWKPLRNVPWYWLVLLGILGAARPGYKAVLVLPKLIESEKELF